MLSNLFFLTRNVANIRYSDKNDWLGQLGEKKGFVEFCDEIYSIRALMVLLRNYIRRGIDTPESIVSRFAPPSENSTVEYINFVRDYLSDRGRFPNVIDPKSVDFRLLCEAICLFETGYRLTLTTFAYVCQRFNL